MKLSRFLSIALLSFLAFPAFLNADQLEDAKAAIKNEDFEKVYEFLLPLSEENNAEAQFLLGTLYINGQGVEKDDTKGLSWIMKSARQGYDQAIVRALSIYSELANQGDASAMYNLGYMYLHGWGVEQDTDIGIGWLESAAKIGHVRSAKFLSGIYAEGKFGITPDENKASFWSNLPVESASGIDVTRSREAPVQGGPLTEYTFDSDAQEYMLDDVIVTGDSSLLSLKMEMIRAEDLQFEIFNSLNSTDEFDITCEWRAPLGSRIPRRFCDAGYLKKAREEDARRFMENMTEGSTEFTHRSDEQLTAELAHKTEALNKEMIALAIKHPELATAMIRSHELNRLFQEEKRERYNDSWLRYLAGNSESIENKDIMNEIDMWEKVFIDHSEGKIQDNIWERWDRWCKTKLQNKYYQKKWESVNQNKYVVEFKSYINAIISGN